MKNAIRKILSAFKPQAELNISENIKGKAAFETWQRNGYPIPAPHLVKQRIIAEYQQQYKYSTLVETGTFLGDMVEAQKRRFTKIVSIELSNELYIKARKRFRKDSNVLIMQGDSGKQLPKILKDITEPIIFWLDGHYSEGKTAKGDKDCPIFEELDAIFSTGHYDHIILIDDARYFIGKGDYPRVETLAEYVHGKNIKYKMEVKHDIIRFTV